MKKYTLFVLTNAVEGKEEEYNDWYTNQHLADVLRVPGFVSAQRFKLTESVVADKNYAYAALYGVETDDPHAALAAMNSAAGTPAMPISEAMAAEMHVALFAPITDLVTAA